jgi:alkylated DNA repair dioxygenase AlkB
MSTPPIEIKAAFIGAADVLFEWLKNSVEWDKRMRARKTASYGVAYNYSQITYQAKEMLPELEGICGRIEQELGFRPNNCLLNYYPDGGASMGFHSDSSEELEAGTGVAIVSLGSVRAMTYRKKDDKSVQMEYPLASGSLLYMPDEVQQQWLHAVLKSEKVGARISLTFRSIVK